MTPDPRWLEILKASGWKTAAIAATCAIFLALPGWGFVPAIPDWAILVVVFAGLLTALLTLASFIVALNKFLQLHKRFALYLTALSEKRAVRAYIPHMTEDERKIIGYLLARNQKMFTAEMTGGNAVTLISRSIVVRALQPGQAFSAYEDVPMAIPDHIWDELVPHKDKFPNTVGARDPHPWRVHWMAR